MALMRAGRRGVVALHHERRVEVAVAGMPEDADAQPVLRRRAARWRQQLRHAAAGHADVLHARHALPAQRPVRLAPRLAQPVGLGGVGRTDL